jgi:hypothetical protein
MMNRHVIPIFANWRPLGFKLHNSSGHFEAARLANVFRVECCGEELLYNTLYNKIFNTADAGILSAYEY